MYFRSDTVCYLKKTSNATDDTGKFDKFYTTKTNLIRKNTKAQFKITKMLVCRENYFLIPKVFSDHDLDHSLYSKKFKIICSLKPHFEQDLNRTS